MCWTLLSSDGGADSARELDPEVVLSATKQSLIFLGNTLAHFNLEWRSKALSRLNPNLKSLVEDEDFSQVAPYLFGSGFERKAKELLEVVERLRKVSLDLALKAVFSRQTFLTRRKWEHLPRLPIFLRENMSATVLVKSESTKKFWSEVPSK